MNIQNPEEVVVSPELEEEAALLSYWTEERMAAAKPLSILVPAESVDNAHFSTPQPAECLSGDSRAPEDDIFLPRPKFSTSLVKDMNVFPYQCVGKLFYVKQGIGYVCSAYVIGESTIGTAGHCIYENRNWATKVIFCARYNNGCDIGRWPMKRLATLKGWVEGNDSGNPDYSVYQYDMAFGLAHCPIRPTTGKLGWMARCPVDQDPYTQIGYPAEPIKKYPFDGKRMWKTVGNYISHTRSNGKPMVIRAGGNMNAGSSGGPWAVFKNGHWRVNGVKSHRIENMPHFMHSSYFGQGFVNLIEWMEKIGGDESTSV